MFCKETCRWGKSNFFCLIGYSTTDISSKEQYSIAIHNASENFVIHKELIDFHKIVVKGSTRIARMINDAIVHFSFFLFQSSRQYWDGAVGIAGSINGVQAQMVAENPKVFLLPVHLIC